MRCRITLLTLILLITVPNLYAQSTVGIISYLEGEVAVARNGKYLNPDEVTIGLEVGSFDTVETGADGYVELQMSTPISGSRVRVRPSSTFYFKNTPRTSKASSMTFQLLRGSLALKVGRLLRLDSYAVQTDYATITVRGTDFSVDISQNRSTLVSVSEGIVRSEVLGRSVLVEPGIVALVDQNARLSIEIVDKADLEMYRQFWHKRRLEALRINASLSIQHYSRLWDHQLPRLRHAMTELESHIEIFQRWSDFADSPEKVPPFVSEIIRDEIALSKGMLALRAILPLAERTYYTLLDLRDVYEQGYAEGQFSAGQYRDAADFYASFQTYEVEMRSTLGRARWMIEIYGILNSEKANLLNSNMPSPDFISR